MAALNLQFRPETSRLLRQLGGLRRIDLTRPLTATGLFIKNEASRLLRERPRDWGPHSGALAKSIGVRVTRSRGRQLLQVGTNLVYGRMQQVGGVVVPKRGKYLAIPVDRRLRGTNPSDMPRSAFKFGFGQIRIGRRAWYGPVLRYAKSGVKQTGRQIRDVAGRFTKRAGAGDVAYALVKRVTIVGRPYLIGNSARVMEFASKQIAAHVERVVKGIK